MDSSMSFADIRELYIKSAVKNILKPLMQGTTDTDLKDLHDILKLCFHNLEKRIRDCVEMVQRCLGTVFKGMSCVQAVKHELRSMEAYVMLKCHERLNSRTISTSGSDSDSDVVDQAWRQFYPQLVDNLQLSGTFLLDHLIQSDCLDDNDVKSIRSKAHNRQQNECFLHLISTRFSGQKIRDYVLPAMTREHAHLVDQFWQVVNETCQLRSSRCPHCKLKGQVEPKVVAEAMYSTYHMITENELKDLGNASIQTEERWNRVLAKVDDAQVLVQALLPRYKELHDELLQKGELVNVHECTCGNRHDIVTISGCDDSDSVFDSRSIETTVPGYPMRSSTRGICVIIHNTDTKHGSGILLKSDRDTAKTEKLFTSLGFVVRKITNLTKKYILNELRSIAHEDHSSYDAFACVVILPGADKDHICDVSMESVHIAYLVEPFRTSKCPTLAGKPKIFVFPYGTGNNRELGYVLKQATPLSTLETTKTVIPEDADILYARATPPGYIASYCKNYGSWYLNNLQDVINRYSDSMDLVTCLGLVNEGVGRVDYTKNDVTYTQTSHITSTLRMRVYLRKVLPSRSPEGHLPDSNIGNVSTPLSDSLTSPGLSEIRRREFSPGGVMVHL